MTYEPIPYVMVRKHEEDQLTTMRAVVEEAKSRILDHLPATTGALVVTTNTHIGWLSHALNELNDQGKVRATYVTPGGDTVWSK